MTKLVEGQLSGNGDNESILGEVVSGVATALAERGLTVDEIIEKIPDIVRKSITNVVPVVVESLHRNKKELLEGLAIDRTGLEQQISADFGVALANYEASSYLAYELGDRTHKGYIKSGAADRFPPACQALFLLHGRALTVAAEILHLLRGGFGDGANARHRTLHEIAVTMSALSGSRADELAGRYFEHAAVERYRDMSTFQTHCADLGYEPFDERDLANAREQLDRILEKYGKSFAKPNAWALPLFPDAQYITFSTLEAEVGMAHKRPFYRDANHHIHAGARAALMNLRKYGLVSRIGVGARAGEDIAETGHASLIHLLACTAALVSQTNREMEPDFDTAVGLEALMVLVEHAGRSFGRAARRLRVT